MRVGFWSQTDWAIYMGGYGNRFIGRGSVSQLSPRTFNTDLSRPFSGFESVYVNVFVSITPHATGPLRVSSEDFHIRDSPPSIDDFTSRSFRTHNACICCTSLGSASILLYITLNTL